MKYKIGDKVFWVEASANHGKEIPCPMCYGKKVVTIILGNGEPELSQCGFCQHGTDAPSGRAKTWEPSAVVHSGIISGISSRDGIKYELGWRSLREHELFDDEASAQKVCAEKLIEQKQIADAWFKESFVNAKKKQIWSNGYHKGCIAQAERTIEWHRYRLGLIAKREPAAAGD